MTDITLVTGNVNKLTEWQRLLPSGVRLDAADVDLDEIQSLDLYAIITDKAKRAYDKIKSPVIVEDIAVSIESLNGLPGPFIKFFVKQLGNDCLVRLAGKENEPTAVTCIIAYFDGENMVVAEGVVNGVSVTPRGPNGFGFDFGFMPDGSGKTYAEMTATEKDSVSHRSLAVRALIGKLKAEQII
jgi:non-canonical purine NTP pyrophosphatase (RdgB/HAM1 family)